MAGAIESRVTGSDRTQSCWVKLGRFKRTDRSPVMLHSDRGTQITSDGYQLFLKGHGLVCSMRAVGSRADNAAIENFFCVFKHQRVNRRHYLSRSQARSDVFDYIERFYNPENNVNLNGKYLLIYS